MSTIAIIYHSTYAIPKHLPSKWHKAQPELQEARFFYCRLQTCTN